MELTIILSIIGAIMTVGITINGYFLKGIMTSQNIMQVELAKVIVKIESYSTRLESLEHNVRKLELNHMECRSKCESSNSSL